MWLLPAGCQTSSSSHSLSSLFSGGPWIVPQVLTNHPLVCPRLLADVISWESRIFLEKIDFHNKFSIPLDLPKSPIQIVILFPWFLPYGRQDVSKKVEYFLPNSFVSWTLLCPKSQRDPREKCFTSVSVCLLPKSPAPVQGDLPENIEYTGLPTSQHCPGPLPHLCLQAPMNEAPLRAPLLPHYANKSKCMQIVPTA